MALATFLCLRSFPAGRLVCAELPWRCLLHRGSILPGARCFRSGMQLNPRFTRITIVSSGDEQILSQIEKQLRKLEDVVDIKALKAEESVCRELIMVKLRANAAQRGEIISVADIFRAKIVDVEEDCLIM